MQTPFRVFILACCLIFWSACSTKRNAAEPMLIDLQPYTDIDSGKVQFVYKELLKVYPYVTLKKPIRLPESAFYTPAGRYRADSLIAQLRRNTPRHHITIGLTGKDISTSKNGKRDWGVMGLGYCPGNACVASDFRLSEKDKWVQLFKVAIHELGHTQGLPHCPVQNCFMRDAKGKNHTDEETDFCPACKQVLLRKGLKFPETPKS
ncbi:MAG: matrixin family metalloprotease [Chitinophagaceae bacterium]|nr:matrixin family metalloprotease [Chitinophagaceae bacterium]